MGHVKFIFHAVIALFIISFVTHYTLSIFLDDELSHLLLLLCEFLKKIDFSFCTFYLPRKKYLDTIVLIDGSSRNSLT